MPNHISNRLTITGEAEKVAKVFDAIKGEYKSGEDRPIDFNKIIPMPKILPYVGKGRTNLNGEAVNSWWTDADAEFNDPNKKPNRLLTTEEKAEIAATGFPDWYDWSIAKWGTKWNAYDQKQLTDNAIYFETAWSAPIPVIEALAAAHPDIEITLEYADEDKGSNAGIVKYSGGKMVEEQDLEDAEAVKLWFNLNDTDPKDYGYDPVTFEYVGEDDEAA